MTDIIEVNSLYKKYKLGEIQPYLTLRDTISQIFKLPNFLTSQKIRNDEFWALKDVSFSLSQGNVLGIIGPNGSGKSTLLKILSRITPPTSGYITLKGRIASLLEVGTGFNPELTGRDNIYLNGAILGMTRNEIKSQFSDIVEFSGIEKFIDTPVKHYSSGMYVRLAFAVAAHLNPEILLIDEVLAVGDISFQKKCLGKMGEIAHSGRTIIFVSHNMDAIRQLCTETIWLEKGQIKRIGDTRSVVEEYIEQSLDIQAKTFIPNDPNRVAQINSISILNNKAELTADLDVNEPFKIEVNYKIKENLKSKCLLGINFYDVNTNALILNTYDADSDPNLYQNLRKKGNYKAMFQFPPNLFNALQFKMWIYLALDSQTKAEYHKIENLLISFYDSCSFATKIKNGSRGGYILQHIPSTSEKI